MKTYKFRAAATVSCWTEIEAESEDQARRIAEDRELSCLCYGPFTSPENESWHFDSDGSAFDIALDSVGQQKDGGGNE